MLLFSDGKICDMEDATHCMKPQFCSCNLKNFTFDQKGCNLRHCHPLDCIEKEFKGGLKSVVIHFSKISSLVIGGS